MKSKEGNLVSVHVRLTEAQIKTLDDFSSFRGARTQHIRRAVQEYIERHREAYKELQKALEKD